MPEKRGPIPTAFISSTVEDLRPFRAAARDGAIDARLLPDMQEYFSAQDNPALTACLKRVAQADVLVLVVAHRYGWVPADQSEGGSKSITWLEAEHAVRSNKEVLAFVVDDGARWEEESKEEYALVRAAREVCGCGYTGYMGNGFSASGGPTQKAERIEPSFVP